MEMSRSSTPRRQGRTSSRTSCSGSNQEPSQGYDETFEPDLDRKYVCPVCLAAFRDAIQTKCGHRFCKTCLKGVVGTRRFAKCPVDNTWFDAVTDVFDDNAVRREVLSLRVKCHNMDHGCQWAEELRDLQDHLQNCDYVLVDCEHRCGSQFPKCDIANHSESCPKRLKQCQYCSEHIIHTEMTKHQLLHCMQFPVNCTACGETGILRINIADHVDVVYGGCPYTKVPCKFQSVGCHYQGPRKNISEHYQEAVDSHLALLSTYLNLQETRLQLQVEELEDSREACSRLADLAKQQHRLIEEQQLVVRSQLDHVQFLESTTFNGKLLWKVPIPEDHSQTLVSPSFYTACPGYKFSVQLELDGYQDVGEIYTSVFVILEEGCYDNQLIFPVDATCHITIYNQHKESRDHVHTSIKCNSVTRASSPGGSNENTKRGRLRLMKKDDLLSSQFLLDNALSVLINVDLDCCPHACIA
ncbi:TNF receptor-associated factor 6 [Lingula anatina]|uniref:TNF receptor-associated factor 6 n=1 Tax=Lingula anatina TaxID=7574 RepID=A0A1S3HFD7_LINAN|nr:TNF receptor-associated factor 6 [Lingula anatina]|eukprot:XP_013384755.1 TNF receptor-associated factor 6 [Lingula anatina]